MNKSPTELDRLFEEQLCYFWQRNDFNTWAKGAGFMSSLLGHPAIRDALKWLVNVRAVRVQEGDWHELPTS